MTDFKTQVDLEISFEDVRNFDLVTQKFNLRWKLEMETRMYGIKGFNIIVPNQPISVTINVWGDKDDTEEQKTLEIKDVEVIRKSKDDIIPRTLEYYKGQWRLYFA